MKKLYPKFVRIVVLLTTVLFCLHHGTAAQCIAPSLQFKNPVLIAGIDKKVGAVYKFPNIINSVDAQIRIDSLVGGATLLDIDVTGFGYDHAWQPRVNGPKTPAGNKSYIRWTITFTQTGTNTPVTLPCMSLSAIDIDGDDVGIKEFVEAKNVNSYFNLQPSTLSISSANNNILAVGSVANKKDIDTLAFDTNIQFNYSNVSSISICTGAIVNNTGSNLSSERYNCLYFKNIEVASTLPVRFLSFSARAVEKNKVKLNWVTEIEVNNKQFEIQRSFDGKEFNTVGMIFSLEGAGYKAYEFTDQLPAGSQGKVYYRIKQVDLDNKYSFTKILPVTLSETGSLFVKVSPNPVVNDMTIVIENAPTAASFLRISDLSGREIYRKGLEKQSNGVIRLNAQTANMRMPGFYVAEILFEDGSRVTQKLIKR